MNNIAPITINSFSDELLNKLSNSTSLSIKEYLYDELKIGLVEELGVMQTYNMQALNSEKIAKAFISVMNNLKNNPSHYSNPKGADFAHVLTGKQNMPAGALRQYEGYIEKLVDEEMINEGFFDFISKVKAAPSQAWESIKASFAKALTTAKNSIQNKIKQLESATPYLEKWKNIIAEAEKETGEKFPVTNTLKIAYQLPQKAKSANIEVQSDKNSIQKKAPETSQPEQQKAQESFYRDSTKILESINLKSNKSKLNESVTATTIIGFILAIIGGIPMLLNGLYKLAKKYNFEKCAEAFQHAYHVAHEIEKKTIDIVIPDKLSYTIYKKIFKMGFRPKGAALQQLISFEDFTADKFGIRHHIEETVYKLLLTYFFVLGVGAVLNAGMTMLSAAEAGATTVKAVEIAKAVTNTIELVAPGLTTAAKAAAKNV